MEEEKVETKEVVKKKGSCLFTLFACVMTAIIVFLATNLGQKAAKVVDPDTTKSGSSNTTETSNVESNEASNEVSNETSNASVITNDKIIGSYKYQADNYEITLTFLDDGTFVMYKVIESHYAGTTYGTYGIVDSNTIKVTTVFTTTSGGDYSAENDTINYKLNEDGSLTIPASDTKATKVDTQKTTSFSDALKGMFEWYCTSSNAAN